MQKPLQAVFAALILTTTAPHHRAAAEACPLKLAVKDAGELCLSARTVRHFDLRPTPRFTDQRPGTKILKLRLTPDGQKKLARLLQRNVGKTLLVKFRASVVSAHTIREPILGSEFAISVRLGAAEEAVLWHIRNWRSE